LKASVPACILNRAHRCSAVSRSRACKKSCFANTALWV